MLKAFLHYCPLDNNRYLLYNYDNYTAHLSFHFCLSNETLDFATPPMRLLKILNESNASISITPAGREGYVISDD
jgi:hypothetical protein